MPNTPDLKAVLTFLSGLRENNNKPWFEAHRSQYESARAEFEGFVDGIIQRLGAFEDMQGVSARDCVMRIYRDIRFSKDKSPYKTAMSASIGPGGRKAYRFQYYVHLEPQGHSMLAGGLHEPESSQLNAFRRAIDKDPRPFKRLVAQKDFKEYFGEIGGEKLKTAPQGFDRDHPEIELLRMKEVVAARLFSDREVTSADFLAEVIDGCKAMRPFLDYLSSVVS